MEFKSKSFRKLSSMLPCGRYAVAVSGGVDSMVLMHLLSEFHKQNPSSVPVVLTVNHGFRAEAVNEVNFVKTQATALGLECHILNWSGNVQKKSQEVAREIRYGLLVQCCAELALKVLLTAHTKNDQAETVLLRLERGSGIDGLAGIRGHSTIGDFTIIRPLLDFTRKEITEYAVRNNQQWIEDPSNNDHKYRRAFYRQFINESDNPEVLVNRLYVTAQHMRKALSCISHYVTLAVDECLEFSPLGCVVIKSEIFRKLHEEIARRLLLLLLMTVGNRPLKPRYQKFNSAFMKVCSDKRFASFTLHGCKVLSNKDGNVIVAREAERIAPRTYVEGRYSMQWDARFELSLDNVDIVKRNSSTDNMLDGAVEEEQNVIDSEKPYISPLGIRSIPDSLQHDNMNKYVVRGLPVLVKGDKVLAYPMQNNKICNIPAVVLRRVLLRERVVSLICSQLDL